MAMVSMETKSDGPMVDNPNPYGYGTSICLTDDQVEALGLDKNPPAAGTKVNISAVAVVVSKSERTDLGGGDGDGDIDVSLTLQITDMEVTAASGAMKDGARKLYGGDNG